MYGQTIFILFVRFACLHWATSSLCVSTVCCVCTNARTNEQTNEHVQWRIWVDSGHVTFVNTPSLHCVRWVNDVLINRLSAAHRTTPVVRYLLMHFLA